MSTLTLSEAEAFAFLAGQQDYRDGVYHPIWPSEQYNAGYDSAEAESDPGMPAWAGADISNIY